MKPTIRPVASLTLLLSFVFSVASLSANAIEIGQAKNLYQTIHDARLKSYMVLNSYYDFSTEFDDKARLKAIENYSAKLDYLINQLDLYAEVSVVQNRLSDIKKTWGSYKKLVRANIDDTFTNGYPELQLVYDMGAKAIDLETNLSKLYSGVKGISEYKPHRMLEQSRETALTMALMMTQYSSMDAAIGEHLFFLGEYEDKALDSLAQDFDRALAALIAQAQDQRASQHLKSARVTWNFIKNSYYNYMENKVSFILNRYSMRILASLEETTAIYENS